MAKKFLYLELQLYGTSSFTKIFVKLFAQQTYTFAMHEKSSVHFKIKEDILQNRFWVFAGQNISGKEKQVTKQN